MQNVFVWVGHVWSDRVKLALEHYGDRITDVSIFGWHVDAQGTLTETFDPTLLDPYREKWPHLRFWLGFRNDGIASIFTGLRESATARANLITGLSSALAEYPWLDGIDIDLEQGGGAENAPMAELIFSQVAGLAHDRGKLASAALPPLTSTGSVGGEDWVRYKQVGAMLDHVAIMSYDFAWSGSAPGPISPGFWLENVYDWATTQITPRKLSMGLPLYSYFWQIHDYPANLGNTWRGDSGTFYAAWQHFTGFRAHDGSDANPAGSGSHHQIGWINYRDPSSKSLWGFLDCYDWRDSHNWESSDGLTVATFDGKEYTVRYGLPSAEPLWSVTDNAANSSYSEYRMNPEPVTDIHGALVSPKSGYALTVELLKRDAVAATIIDDYATDSRQLDMIYTTVSGSWEHWQEDGYKQYRGSGRLDFNNSFGAQSLYVQARFQWAEAGTVRVHSQGITAEVTNTGTLRLLNGSTVLAETTVSGQTVGAAAGEGRAVLGLRVREGSARVYYSHAETRVPVRLHVSTTPPGGSTGISATSETWVDHAYLGDGWWYQPREAVEVQIGGESRVMGRFPRTGITWDEKNRFRPDTDVDELETRESEASLDWVYEHWQGFPVVTGQDHTVRVIPLDHDVWVGRIMLLDKAGASIVYFADVETITHWRGRAALDWGLQGIALWTLGQEDVRLWPALAGGYLTPETKRLNS